MTIEDQFRSLTLELQSLKNRVRNFRHTKHWLADGEWKELVLRNVLQRHFPAHIEPLRGFVVDGQSSSKQVDILLYDNRYPCLFRAGDFVFVTPDAVAGIIEVKSNIADASRLARALEPIADNISGIRQSGNRHSFAGLFAFDATLDNYGDLPTVLDRLNEASKGDQSRVIDFVCLGQSLFVLFWKSPDDPPDSPERWHAYVLDDLAPGYFINNLVYSVAGASVQRNMEAWFPNGGKKKAVQELDIDMEFGRVHPGGKQPTR